jgi:hypothetical protein
LATWALFLISHLSAAAYAFVNKGDWTLACVFIGNAAGSGGILVAAAIKRWQFSKRQAKACVNVIQMPLRRAAAS